MKFGLVLFAFAMTVASVKLIIDIVRRELHLRKIKSDVKEVSERKPPGSKPLS